MSEFGSKIVGSANQYVTGNTVKIMLEGNNVHLRPALLQAISDQFEFDYQKIPTSYPYGKYLSIVTYLGSVLYPGKSRDEADEALGYNAIQAYFRGPIGQVIKATASIMGPQRAAKQFLRNIRTALPWATHEMEEVSPTRLRYRVRDGGGRVALMRGVLRASLEITGVKVVRLETKLLSPGESLHEMEWTNSGKF